MTATMNFTQIQLLQNIELQELAYLRESYRGLPADLASHAGAGFQPVGGGGAAVTAKVDILGLNRVVGLGIHLPLTEAILEEALQIYSEAGAPRFFIQLSKVAETEAATQLLIAKGFRHHNNWAKLYRPVTPLPAGETHLRITPIDAGQSEVFADIIVRCFEWPEILKPFLAHPVGRPGWRHYLAFEGNTAVACAALYIEGEFASLAFAATLPPHRGKGAQSALVARRFRDAAAAGCRWMVVETAEEKPERPAPSYRNMRRLGFHLAALRPNYLYAF